MMEQPGKLYLGREFDIAAQTATDTPFMLPLRDLTTHAVCLGMTGSGKTGLGICLLEEVLLQGIPAIIIDPKGDITNLALSFADFAPEQFKPWLDADEAANQHVTLDALAEQTAAHWKSNLVEWDITQERLQQMRDRVTCQIFTPGSDAGIGVNILQGLNPPDPASGLTWERDAEIMRERISQIVSALLSLAGIESDPLKGREHILLATLFETTWRVGQPIDVAFLIRMIQEPPVSRVGVFDMNVFYPKAERFELAMALNNLLASPTFSAWQTGQPLDIPALLKPLRDGGANPAGKTRANIFYIAHLQESERHFFVTLLLSQLVLWMRAQTGTSILRCLVYFDEVFGYCPPFPRNPPPKTPLMTIIKQGRSAGLGMVLGTQNPADLDYKGLANMGAWFIGRLRTARDRMRALEGLESAGVDFDRAEFEGPLSNLPQRVFLSQTATGPAHFFQVRWAMSYLRGPLTREQVRRLVSAESPSSAPATPPDPAALGTPALPPHPPSVPGMDMLYLPSASPSGGGVTYRAHLLASAQLHIADRASGIAADIRHTVLHPLNENVKRLPDFDTAKNLDDFDLSTLQHGPVPGAAFEPLPSGVTPRWLKDAHRAYVEHVYRNSTIAIFRNRSLKLYSRVGETQLEFRQRCEHTARPLRDAAAARVHRQFERRMAMLQDKLAGEQRELTADRADLDARRREQTLTNVESVFNFVVGRRQSRGATKRRQTQAARQDVRESESAIARLNTDLQQLSGEYRAALDALNTQWMNAFADIEPLLVMPKKSDIYADIVAIAWVP
ncbi:MAG TPA: DUF87 domain-containing protein [Anaerolineae bacterium]